MRCSAQYYGELRRRMQFRRGVELRSAGSGDVGYVVVHGGLAAEPGGRNPYASREQLYISGLYGSDFRRVNRARGTDRLRWSEKKTEKTTTEPKGLKLAFNTCRINM